MNSKKSFLLVPDHSIFAEENTITIETAEVDMINTLGEQFDKIGIAAFKARSSNSSMSGKITRSKLMVHTINCTEHTNRAKKLINYIFSAIALPFVIRNYSFIYVFCPGHCGLLAALWAMILRKPYGIYVRCTWLNAKGETPLWWSHVFSNAKFMIVTGESFKRKLLRHCDNVANEVPLTALTPKQVRTTDLLHRSLSRMVFVGRLNESKGVRDALRAVAFLKQQGILVELLVAGGGKPNEIHILEKLKKELCIEDCVVLLGHVSPAELANIYKSCATFVFPSYYTEGFPRVLYEAMMYGLAIVTCEMPGTEGFLIDGKNCIYTPPANPEKLAANLRRLLEDSALVAELSKNARRDVERVYETFIDASHTHQIFRLLNSVECSTP